MGIGARWKHFKIYVELTANFALLIFPSLEGLVKVLGGIWIVGGKGDAITAQSRVFCMEQAVGFGFFFFCKAPSQSGVQPGTGGVAAHSRAAPCISGLSAKPAAQLHLKHDYPQNHCV